MKVKIEDLEAILKNERQLRVKEVSKMKLQVAKNEDTRVDLQNQLKNLKKQ